MRRVCIRAARGAASACCVAHTTHGAFVAQTLSCTRCTTTHAVVSANAAYRHNTPQHRCGCSCCDSCSYHAHFGRTRRRGYTCPATTDAGACVHGHGGGGCFSSLSHNRRTYITLSQLHRRGYPTSARADDDADASAAAATKSPQAPSPRRDRDRTRNASGQSRCDAGMHTCVEDAQHNRSGACEDVNWMQRQQRILYPQVRMRCAETDLRRRRHGNTGNNGDSNHNTYTHDDNDDENDKSHCNDCSYSCAHVTGTEPHRVGAEPVAKQSPRQDSRPRRELVRPEREVGADGAALAERSTPTPATHTAEGEHTSTSVHSAEVDDRLDAVQIFLKEAERQQEARQRARNTTLPYPTHPDTLVPSFRRIRQHTATQKQSSIVTVDPDADEALDRCEADTDVPQFVRRDAGAALPRCAAHPWVSRTPMGPFIVHGDGQLRITGGTGEVGFEDEPWPGGKEFEHGTKKVGTSGAACGSVSTTADVAKLESASSPRLCTATTVDSTIDHRVGTNHAPIHDDAEWCVNASGTTCEGTHAEDAHAAPHPALTPHRHFRGLRHESILHRRLPQLHGRVEREMILRHSVNLTGRGVFATRAIRRGESIMIVQSTAHNTGVRSELRRLEEMCVHVIDRATHGGAAERQFLHDWIITGQPSSRLESWPATSSQRVLHRIGGVEALWKLQLHPIHIARIAAIVDLNSFLVESAYAVRKGMAYFAEASFFNHSCCANVEYDVMPAHTFAESEYYLDERAEEIQDSSHKRYRTTDLDAGHNDLHDENSDIRDDSIVVDEMDECCLAQDSCDCTHTKKRAAKRNDEDALSAMPSRSASDQATRNASYLAELSRANIALDESGAPEYLFCARACRDIAAGEELLISYVPAHWSFDNRQYVLHDRYHFWCKCPRCSPVIDAQLSRIPKFIVGIVIFSIVLQMWVFRLRSQHNACIAEGMRQAREQDEEDEMQRHIQHHDREAYFNKNNDPRSHSGHTVNASPNRAGLLELIEQRKRDKAFEWEWASAMHPAMEDWIMKPPR